jgi:nucleoside-diphosphate-sugar epimerase
VTGRTALVIGGTGPTGPHIVDGLLDRQFDVTVFHRGIHEVDFAQEVEHLHGDPHFHESAEALLSNREFDVVVATYGRTRLLAEVLAHRCEQFIGIGSVTIYRGASDPESWRPSGTRILAKEESELVDLPTDSPLESVRFRSKIRATETEVMELGESGAFSATYYRYPIIYGPRNIIPWEWSVVRRVADDRRFIMVHDEGLNLKTRICGRNAAHAVLLAVDNPKTAAGQIYNCGDDDQFSLRGWLELLIEATGGSLEIVSLPKSIASPSWALMPLYSSGAPHMYVDTSKIKSELGYSDVISTSEALAEAVEWYRRNPVTAETHKGILDKFDYALEDALLRAYQGAIEEIRQKFSIEMPEVYHPYPHPKLPNERDHRDR